MFAQSNLPSIVSLSDWTLNTDFAGGGGEIGGPVIIIDEPPLRKLQEEQQSRDGTGQGYVIAPTF